MLGSLYRLDNSWSTPALPFSIEWIDETLPAAVVDKGKEVLVTCCGSRFHGSAQITVNEFRHICCSGPFKFERLNVDVSLPGTECTDYLCGNIITVTQVRSFTAIGTRLWDSDWMEMPLTPSVCWLPLGTSTSNAASRNVTPEDHHIPSVYGTDDYHGTT